MVAPYPEKISYIHFVIRERLLLSWLSNATHILLFLRLKTGIISVRKIVIRCYMHVNLFQHS